jgi:hypothetical protein
LWETKFNAPNHGSQQIMFLVLGIKVQAPNDGRECIVF